MDNDTHKDDLNEAIRESSELRPKIFNWESSKAALIVKLNRANRINRALNIKNAILGNRADILEKQLTSVLVLLVILIGG